MNEERRNGWALVALIVSGMIVVILTADRHEYNFFRFDERRYYDGTLLDIRFPYCDERTEFTLIVNRAGAPPLPREGETIVVDFTSAPILETCEDLPPRMARDDKLRMMTPRGSINLWNIDILRSGAGTSWNRDRVPQYIETRSFTLWLDRPPKNVAATEAASNTNQAGDVSDAPGRAIPSATPTQTAPAATAAP